MPPDGLIPDIYVNAAGRWAIVGLLAVLGGAIGSFINVVVYRLPRGGSLLYPGSQCPACGKSIRWYDNVPVLGWLWLRGRCRDCRTRISIRYPTVELLVAAASALLAWAEVFQAAGAPTGAGQVFALEFAPYAFHLLLVCPLMAAALIEYDGNRPPAPMLAVVLVLGFAVGSIWPALRPVELFSPGPLRGAYDGAAGFLAAAILSALAWPAWVMSPQRAEVLAGAASAAVLAIVGVFLGAADVAVIGTFGMAYYTLARMIHSAVGRGGGRRWLVIGKLGWAGWLTGVTLFRIVTGLPRVELPDDWTLVVNAGLAMAIMTLLWRLVALVVGRAVAPRTSKAP